jgi:ribonuclease HII
LLYSRTSPKRIPKQKMSNLIFESLHWDEGRSLVAGVDEAGRGPLAGPIVIAAVILNPRDFRNNDVISDFYQDIKDSKLITPKKRQILFDFITKVSISYSIVEIDNFKIDRVGIMEANTLGFNKALQGLKKYPHHVLTDHYKVRDLPSSSQTNIIRGDSASMTISAASILAKVHRDKIMEVLDNKYPVYGFAQHKGYGTKLHREKILKYGPCEIHRRTFEPIKSLFRQKA